MAQNSGSDRFAESGYDLSEPSGESESVARGRLSSARAESLQPARLSSAVGSQARRRATRTRIAEEASALDGEFVARDPELEVTTKAETEISGKRKRLTTADRKQARKAKAKARAKAAEAAEAQEAAEAAQAAALEDTGSTPEHGKHSVTKSEYSRSGAASRYAARKGAASGKKKVLIAVAAVLVVGLLFGGFALASWYGTIAGNLRGDGQITDLPVANHDEPYYVLLLGGDSRKDTKEDNRTDSMMVARIDEKNKDVSLVSIPRDLRVAIDGHGFCKINSAIEYGSYNQVVKTVNDVLGIQVSYYAFIYFSGFKDLVDKLGGVNVDVPEGTTYRGVWVPAGEDVLINGKEALVLARCRHGYPPDQGAYAMGDYQRTLNQRNLIKAIAKKVLQQDASQLPGLVEGVSECVETNMSPAQIVATANAMRGMNTDKLSAAQLPVAGATINGEWFAIMYKDVFEVMCGNFKEGRSLKEGLDGFKTDMYDTDIGTSYTDEAPYSSTSYTNLFGNFREKNE